MEGLAHPLGLNKLTEPSCIHLSIPGAGAGQEPPMHFISSSKPYPEANMTGDPVE